MSRRVVDSDLYSETCRKKASNTNTSGTPFDATSKRSEENKTRFPTKREVRSFWLPELNWLAKKKEKKEGRRQLSWRMHLRLAG